MYIYIYMYYSTFVFPQALARFVSGESEPATRVTALGVLKDAVSVVIYEYIYIYIYVCM